MNSKTVKIIMIIEAPPEDETLYTSNTVQTFPDVQVFLFMGDTAIKSFNVISKRKIGKKVIASGSTYKIRKQHFFYNNKRVFLSYLQTGKNYLIEKSKRKMIAEDIKNAFEIINLKKKSLKKL